MIRGLRLNFHRLSLVFLYFLTIVAALYLTAEGWDYYWLPLTERARHDQHEVLKPSGFISHGAGIVGSALMLILLLYSLRKRWRPMQRGWGDIRYWLNYHIWMGVTGPVLVLYHTTFKFGGIVAVSFWSMMAVALSGVLGRYLYVQIPRSLSGEELSSGELLQMESELRDKLSSEAHGNAHALKILEAFVAETAAAEGGVLSWISRDIGATLRYSGLRRALVQEAGLGAADAKRLVALARKRAVLERRVAFLGTARRLLHHWHIFHKPFAIIMIVIMIVHVAVATWLGYTWIF